jgi:hypothetical protein
VVLGKRARARTGTCTATFRAQVERRRSNGYGSAGDRARDRAGSVETTVGDAAHQRGESSDVSVSSAPHLIVEDICARVRYSARLRRREGRS